MAASLQRTNTSLLLIESCIGSIEFLTVRRYLLSTIIKSIRNCNYDNCINTKLFILLTKPKSITIFEWQQAFDVQILLYC